MEIEKRIFHGKKKINGRLFYSGKGYRLYDTDGFLFKDQINIVWQ